jgi:hypothetical protein
MSLFILHNNYVFSKETCEVDAQLSEPIQESSLVNVLVIVLFDVAFHDLLDIYAFFNNSCFSDCR